MYKKILIPLDGSNLAEAPLSYAAWLALKTNVEFILLNVYSEKIAPRDYYLRETGQLLALRSHQHKGGQLPPVVREISIQGDPATEILKCADNNNVDLIMMSTHGHSGVKHWLLGSVADRVVHYSNRPVWLIKSFEIGEKIDYDRTILVLLDGSNLAEQILPYAADHASLSGGELVLLSVCEPPATIPEVTYHLIPHKYPPQWPLQWGNYIKEEAERREKACRLYLEQNIVKYNSNKYKVRYEYRFGDASSEITKYLEANSVDLVAMTTRGRSGIARRILGNVAEKVLATSKSPLLVMRPRQANLTV
jgi:nucleotide-binding universal stress UspA family protein